MKFSFVTLFDQSFLPQGLALLSSLNANLHEFVLTVLCLDEQSYKYLSNAKFPNLNLLLLSDLETPELLAVKKQRTRVEYYWTLTPWSILWTMKSCMDYDCIIYLDADTALTSSPNALLSSFIEGKHDVLITEHDYSPEHDQTPKSGKYCVQFIAVKPNSGADIMTWWRDRCMDWCFNRFENNLFGDQKYLEMFEQLFPGRIFNPSSSGLFQAPWNAYHFPFSKSLLYHFHGLRIISKNLIYLSGYSIPCPTLEYVYRPYCRILFEAANRNSINFIPQAQPMPFPRLILLKVVKKLVFKILGQTKSPHWAILNRRTGEITIR